MKNNFTLLFSSFQYEKERLGIATISFVSIFLFPLLSVLIFSIFLIIPSTQEFTKSLLDENHIVELLTFAFLFMGSIQGFRITSWSYSKNVKPIIWIFLLAFSMGLFLVAMEEIAWGQQFFHFDTPEIIKPLNAQGELTLHNLNGLQGNSEYFRIFFGVCGLLGMLLYKNDWLKLLAPPKILLSFFILITVISLMDLYADYVTINSMVDKGLHRLSELIEMLIGLAGLLYIQFISKRIKADYEIKH